MKIKMIEVNATVEDLRANRMLSQAFSDLMTRIVDIIGETPEDLNDSTESDNAQEEGPDR